MENKKVYAGFVVREFRPTEERKHLRILPVISGKTYRDTHHKSLGHANDLSRTSIKFVDLLKLMSQIILIKRPNRVEPRVVKRRPKPFKLMVKTRSELKAELLDESHAKLA